MDKIRLALLFICFANTSLFANCKDYDRGKVVCENVAGEDKISVQFFKDGCEFPEGNKTSCLYTVSCLDKKIFKGSAVFRNKDQAKSFCLTSREIDGVQKKAIFKRGSDKQVLLNCSKLSQKNTNEVEITLGAKKVDCNLDKALMGL